MSDLFDFKPQAIAYAVMGNPISHSKSPQIHSAFARQFELDIEYSRIQVDPGGFEQAVSHFFAHGGGGLNITLPFKVEAWQLCQRGNNALSSRAISAQAVNTLAVTESGSLRGDNTDGVGLVRDLADNCGVDLAGKRVLVVGAGGAVRGVLEPLLSQELATLTLVNRTFSRAESLAEAFESNISALALNHVPETPYDVVINGTAASLEHELPGIARECVGTDTAVYDMMYGSEPTLFMTWALGLGAATAHDGLGMLVEQAAESFAIWHGKRPETRPVIAQLRKI